MRRHRSGLTFTLRERIVRIEYEFSIVLSGQVRKRVKDSSSYPPFDYAREP